MHLVNETLFWYLYFSLMTFMLFSEAAIAATPEPGKVIFEVDAK